MKTGLGDGRVAGRRVKAVRWERPDSAHLYDAAPSRERMRPRIKSGDLSQALTPAPAIGSSVDGPTDPAGSDPSDFLFLRRRAEETKCIRASGISTQSWVNLQRMPAATVPWLDRVRFGKTRARSWHHYRVRVGCTVLCKTKIIPGVRWVSTLGAKRVGGERVSCV